MLLEDNVGVIYGAGVAIGGPPRMSGRWHIASIAEVLDMAAIEG